MPVAFDADVLSLVLNPELDPPTDPTTGQPVTKLAKRLELLIADLHRAKTRVVLPAPAVSEFLVIADESGPDYLAEIDKKSAFTIEPFDAMAAVEAAATTRKAIARGNKKSGASGAWQTVKTDRQIVAVAKTCGAMRIYSNDGDVVKIAADCNIEVVQVWQLPIPPEDEPTLFDFESQGTSNEDDAENA